MWSKLFARCALMAIQLFALSTVVGAESASVEGAIPVLHVPAEYATIQAAIDAAQGGGTVLVSPGTYHEGLTIGGKCVRLVSEFDTSGDPEVVQRTILDGATIDDSGNAGVRDRVILVEADADPKTEIVGFTIRGGDDGISCHARVRIAHNYFTRNDDAIDYEGGGGLCEHNKFEKNHDDAVDYDEDCDATVIHNEIIDNEDDGIEIRLQPYRGKTLQITIRDNIITGNAEDGIQIIGYPDATDRRIRIERNLIANNAMAGVGLMSEAVTKEDYRGAAIPEPIEIVNNTIVGNDFGITGGAQLVAINNIIAGSKQFGMMNAVGRSVASHNLFWENGIDFDGESNVLTEHTFQVDPKLGPDHRPMADSPCIGAGVARISTADGNVEIDPSSAFDTKPDLGAFSISSEVPNSGDSE
jgi:Right handed beta helix region